MENLHSDAGKGIITGTSGTPRYFTEEPFIYMKNLPKLPQMYVDDILTRNTSENYGFLPEGRANRTPIMDKSCLFQNTKFIADCEKQFGYCGATILKFDPLSVLDWHSDYPRKCGVNFLVKSVGNKAHTLIREHREGWNYNMLEIQYVLGEPILINTTLEHTAYNYHPTETRLVLSISFGKRPLYNDVKEYLLNYKTVDYN